MNDDTYTKGVRNNTGNELAELHQQFLKLTENILEQREQALSVAEKSLIDSHIDRLKNIGIVSGIVAPFSLTLLTINAVAINAPILLTGFCILIANIALSQILLHLELSKRNESITNASVNLNFARSVREDMQAAKKDWEGMEPTSFFINSIRNIDKALGNSINNKDVLLEKIHLRKYDQIVVFIFTLACLLIISSLFYDTTREIISNIITQR